MSPRAQPLELWVLPHSHADVGWLQTVNSLARVNVSRILDGVVSTLLANPARRFVWDEMAFLQYWWEHDASVAQRTAFRQLVRERRIEMVDNGWSQHDMGATTLESMLNNWVEGHEWIRTNLGAKYAPRIGWSLDPFGMSASQAVFQALMGMDGWFFTRLSAEIVTRMKAERSLEFVWRASSSLPANSSEIFCHVFESYYCMPHEYQFEWSAPYPNASTLLPLAHRLANLTHNRSAWFRTKHVLIPWGCDYMYQAANLTFGATDLLIDTINANTASWGVHVQYGTASEYLDAVRKAALDSPHPQATLPPAKQARAMTQTEAPLSKDAVTFPVVGRGTSFFPYQDWSGYFTSRPVLKQLSRAAHVALRPAEQLFVRMGRSAALSAPSRLRLWSELESARRNAAIFQHHDAITGTFCAASEGCPGTDQDIGSHDVLGNYRSMLSDSIAQANSVFARLAALDLAASGLWASAAPPSHLSLDPTTLGDKLMGQGDGGEAAALFVYNPLASTITEAISLPVPVCAVVVKDQATLAVISSQTTAALDISDRAPPYYDFSLSFVATLPPLGWRKFLIEPVRFARRECVAADVALPAGAAAVHHQSSEAAANAAMPSANRATAPSPAPSGPMVLENRFWRVDIDPRYGLRRALDKTTGEAYPLTHRLMTYAMAPEVLRGAGPAYAMQVHRPARALLHNTTFTPGQLKCRAWRQTIGCDPDGSRDRPRDASCSQLVGGANASGYCECSEMVGLNEEQARPMRAVGCDASGKRHPFTCAAVCAGGGTISTAALHATFARGPVLHEARLQITPEHAERWRLWQSDDPAVGSRLELGVDVGTLEPMSELFSRFTVGGAHPQHGSDASEQLFTEDNGYEAIPRDAAPADANISLGRHVYPSQQSAFLRTNSSAQLALILDRSQGVTHVEAGSIDLMQHRRALPFRGSIVGHTPVVLDDTDRLLSTTWIALGRETQANRLRHEYKKRRIAPPVLAFATVPRRRKAQIKRVTGAGGGTLDLPPSVHLQSVRAVEPNASAFLLRLQHMYATGEDAQRSTTASVDLKELLAVVAPGAKVAGALESTLDGTNDASRLESRRRFPTQHQEDGVTEADAGMQKEGDGDTLMRPMALKTWRVSLEA